MGKEQPPSQTNIICGNLYQKAFHSRISFILPFSEHCRSFLSDPQPCGMKCWEVSQCPQTRQPSSPRGFSLPSLAQLWLLVTIPLLLLVESPYSSRHLLKLVLNFMPPRVNSYCISGLELTAYRSLTRVLGSVSAPQ